MKRLNYKLHCGRRHSPRYWGTVITLILFILPLVYMGYQSQHNLNALAQEKNEIIEKKETENLLFKEKLEASVKMNTPENIKELSRFYIKKYFGKDADKVEKVMNCESGLSNQTINTKSGDYGLYQINKYWHKERFEKMYGVKFEVGVHDWDLSSKYAKFLYDSSGLGPWVCARIVGEI
jgi:hypothetical protein